MSVSTNVSHEATSELQHTDEPTVSTRGLDSSRHGDGGESVMEEVAYSGHLPPPSVIRAYEAVRPGTADWLLRMAEQRIQQRQQHALDALAQSYRWRRLVAWLLFGTVLAVIAVAVILFAKGHSQAAIGVAGGWTTVAIATCLVSLHSPARLRTPEP